MFLLTQLREERGWSKAELARRANLNSSTLSIIERGMFVPYDSQLKKLAKALDVSPKQANSLMEEV